LRCISSLSKSPLSLAYQRFRHGRPAVPNGIQAAYI